MSRNNSGSAESPASASEIAEVSKESPASAAETAEVLKESPTSAAKPTEALEAPPAPMSYREVLQMPRA